MTQALECIDKHYLLMKVTLRKCNQGGKTSLYLDYYSKGKRKTEYLQLYLKPNPKTPMERSLNKKTLQLAETICAQRQIEIQNGMYGFRDSGKLKGSFTGYLQLQAEKRKQSKLWQLGQHDQALQKVLTSGYHL